MSTSSEQKWDPSSVPSDEVVSAAIRRGAERAASYVGAGLVVGGLASLVLARGGGGSRKAIAAFGGGTGLGAAWTRCSMEIEEALGEVAK
mmetsp:Transcript_19740/g.40028  ORF Transcript_19740/g.40028 Transcript_19740/m.40028 type:complete len:90 (+) Transcript_19740:130-399(+)